ncbi:hypothetical protein GACE_2290 [Geoglobus acetivorans]|uniref:Uncharacterized protein n=1 Tax=Geoglobus acetivorans TaxID=565033 RepID=A0A0A7GHJ4_GEOAI|nr:hypothetical protein GACE_2290 [Geoglobus acetivorans]
MVSTKVAMLLTPIESNASGTIFTHEIEGEEIYLFHSN